MQTCRKSPSMPWRSALLNLGAGLLTTLLVACGATGSRNAPATPSAPVPGSTPGQTQTAVGTLSLFAGDPGGLGAVDGAAGAARFSSPVALAADAAGNLFVGDPDNRTIRKVDAGGTVSTFAGRLGFAGWADGATGTSRLAQPGAVALGPDGTLYVGDMGVSGIAAISPQGTMTTLIPGGSNTYTDGVSVNARFNGIMGLALDPAGYLYIADNRNHAIRQLNLATSEVTTVAGGTRITTGTARAGVVDGPIASAQIGYPSGIVWAPGNVLYVSSYRTQTIRKVDLKAGVVSTVAGTASKAGLVDGTGAAALFRSPMGLVLDGLGNLLVADMGNNAIRQIDLASGKVTQIAGDAAGAAGHQDGAGKAATFYQPYGLAMDHQGRLLIGDYYNGTVRRMDLVSAAVTTLAGRPENPGSSDGTRATALFKDAYGLCQDASGNVYVADSGNHVIRRIGTDGTVTTFAGRAGVAGHADLQGAAATFSAPMDVVMDGAGNLLVADKGNHCIRKVDPLGNVSTFAGSLTSIAGRLDGQGTNATFKGPQALALAATGELYVSDTGNYLIRKVLADGTVTTLAGTGSANLADGTGTAASFQWPLGLALDGKGRLYVADAGCNSIRVVDLASAAVGTLAGDAGDPLSSKGYPGALDGTGKAAKFNYPVRVAVDAAGNILVSDYNNQAVRKVTPAGVCTTLVGTLPGDGTTGSLPGIALGSLPGQLDYPKGMLLRADGSLLVISRHCILGVKGY